MKKYFYIIFASILLSACGSSRRSIANTPEDKSLISAVKKLDKEPSSKEIQICLLDYIKMPPMFI